jgi:hypothetical protein
MIKVGDTVQWRGAWGSSSPQKATIESIEVTRRPREKYGNSVNEVDEELVRMNRVVFNLTNGHWCYSSQIDL